jgi:hypothetical protein
MRRAGKSFKLVSFARRPASQPTGGVVGPCVIEPVTCDFAHTSCAAVFATRVFTTAFVAFFSVAAMKLGGETFSDSDLEGEKSCFIAP